MLTHLSIHNYALIDELEIDFREGLSIITGETGAGKSILLGALALILGQRADFNVLLDKSQKCVVEGGFLIKDYGLQDFFSGNELDYDDHTVIRREINQQGKSRAFINDTPVTLDLLKDLGEALVDIHSQHKAITLQDSKFQLAFVDAYIGHDALRENFRNYFFQYKLLQSELTGLLEREKQARVDEDYFSFQYEELNSVALTAGEQEELEKELEILNHSEEIKGNLAKASAALFSGDFSLTASLKDVVNTIAKAAQLHPGLEDITRRLTGCSIELKDIAGEIENAEQRIIYDPKKILDINARLDVIYHLQLKHRAGSIKELLEIMEQFAGKLYNISSLDKQIEAVKKRIEYLDKQLAQLSGKITANRKKAIPEIEKGIGKALKKLAMPEGDFLIAHHALEQYNMNGKDSVVFLFNANRGGEMKELARVASGGELSRLMLCIKSIISVKKLLPTIIFDEIDQGVSGDIADKVGNIMKNMAATMQVITITHLPQIAVKGDVHYLVFKETKENISCTRMKALKEKERITEIAKMLSGDELTKAALDNARALINN